MVDQVVYSTATVLSTILSNRSSNTSRSIQISYRDRGLNKIFNEVRLFKGKNKNLPILGLPNKTGGETYKKFMEIHLNYAIENYKRRNFLRLLLDDRINYKETVIGKEPSLLEGTDKSRLLYSEKEKLKI